MPGEDRLAAELGVSRKTAEAALRLLEHEGLLVGQGKRRRRRIVLPSGETVLRPLRVALMDYDPLSVTEGYMIELHHLLGEAGHNVFFSEKSLMELRMDVRRIARMVHRTPADAWVVVAASREVLQWFIDQKIPTMAMFGRRRGLSIAGVGPDKPPTYVAAARALIALGHRRITMLMRWQNTALPGSVERAFLDELAASGIPTSAYNLPEWEETPKGFHDCLEQLFRLTPPTALLIDEAPFFTAALQFCARQGIRVPKDVSLVCTDPDPGFVWCEPPITHIHWDSGPVVRRIVRWAANVSRGKRDLRQTFTKATFIPGGTIGPAPA